MKIGLFGGSFNPIHTGHLIVIDQALEQLGLDKLIVMPAACNPLKMNNTDMAPAEHRLQMARIATSRFASVPQVEVSDMEIKRGAPSYTIDTVKELRKEGDITLIVGADSFASIGQWKDINQLVDMVTFGIAERWSRIHGTINAATYNDPKGVYSRVKTTSIDIPTFDTSGTEVRERIKAGRSVKYIITDNVAEYIREHGLYVNKTIFKN